MPVGLAGTQPAASGFTAMAQSNNSKVSGVIRDANGEPLVGATVRVKGTTIGTTTDVDGKYSIKAPKGSTLVVTYIGSKPQEIKVTGSNMDVNLAQGATNLDEVVVTALGIKKDRKSLGYAVEDLNSQELMRNKNTNAINSLSGKIAGVNITQSSGAAGAGSQIILRGGTTASEGADNQPLFVVDGVIYSNSGGVVGNSAFDGMMNSSTTSSNRVMDINPEDIENISVLKGPAASALYGSRAANGVVLITTKKGKEGNVEINLNAQYISSWVRDLPEQQNTFKRGYLEDVYDADGNYTGTVHNDFSYNSWGEKGEGPWYDNPSNFFENGGIWDTNLSVSGGTKNSSFYLSGSYYDQDGVVPTTGYTKTTFRFNGEQKYKIFTFGANAAYSSSRTTKTLTGAALYGSSGTGALYAVYNWGPSDDMTHYLNEDGSRYRMFGDRLDPWDERDNPYWLLNKNSMKDETSRFTGNFNVKADITDWWWINYRMGIDQYTTDSHNRIAPNGAIKQVWQNGMMSDNTSKYRYISTNLMTNFNKQFGEFNLNLMLGTATDYTKVLRDYKMAWNFAVPEFYSYNNAANENKQFSHSMSRKRLVGVFGEFRADWRNAIFLTVTGRNDWTSTLPKDERSYFYPSVSGAIAFSELMRESLPEWITFGKLRASWAEVGKDTNPYVTNTYLWPVGNYLEGKVGLGNTWSRGNPVLKPEKTRSTEIGLEMRFLQNRLKFDIAWYKNDSKNQILSPRGPQSTGYIFCSINAGTVHNKGLEISLGGTPIQTQDFSWETTINAAGNRGTMTGLPKGMDIMYLTDVQYGGAKAATFSGGHFMAIAGTTYKYVDGEAAGGYYKDKGIAGMMVLDKNGLPTASSNNSIEIANREPKFTGGWNNTLTYKNWTFNMLWEFRVGGAVFNGTKYAMTVSGTSKFSAEKRQQPISFTGVVQNGTGTIEYNGQTYTSQPIYGDVQTFTYYPDQVATYNGKQVLGANVIAAYYQGAYNYDVNNWITKVNLLRLRTISLRYDVPKQWLASHVKWVKRCGFSFTANNLLLFTNYDGDPEVAASGAGVGGSSSVGFDYCGVPATSSVAFGVNLTF